MTRSKLILVAAAAALAACADATAPDSPDAGAVTPESVSIPATPRSGGSGSSDGGRGPNEEVLPPCLQSVRLASDLLAPEPRCRR
jgi:hypothetical protein